MALVSVGAGPVLVDVSPAYDGTVLDPDAARGLVDAAIEPEEDIHASADYRRHLAHVLVGRAVREATGGGERGMTDVDATVRVSFTVNGAPYDLALPARRLLSDALRHDLRLTGTHVGCEHGVCGACTVLVDGAPMRSCLLFAVSARRRRDHHHRGLPRPRRRRWGRCSGPSTSATPCSAASAPPASSPP